MTNDRSPKLPHLHLQPAPVTYRNNSLIICLFPFNSSGLPSKATLLSLIEYTRWQISRTSNTFCSTINIARPNLLLISTSFLKTFPKRLGQDLERVCPIEEVIKNKIFLMSTFTSNFRGYITTVNPICQLQNPRSYFRFSIDKSTSIH